MRSGGSHVETVIPTLGRWFEDVRFSGWRSWQSIGRMEGEGWSGCGRTRPVLTCLCGLDL